MSEKRSRKEHKRRKKQEKRKVKEVSMLWTPKTRQIFDKLIDRPQFINESGAEITLLPGHQVGQGKTKGRMYIKHGVLYCDENSDFDLCMKLLGADTKPEELAAVFGTRVLSFRAPLSASDADMASIFRD